ncbi:MAG: UbiA family prenyltransferase [Candidatus Micrarchaeota archaeon]|nr:UbiA family prenyltransferase [Candidatus Micrarchaeota archaeon]
MLFAENNIYRKICAIARLTRVEHGIMLSFAVFLGFMIIGVKDVDPFNFIYSLLVPFFAEMGIFALNDLLDYKTDEINRRNDRPLVTKDIKPGEAKVIALICIFLGIFLSSMINPTALIVTTIFSAFGIIYNYRMKDIPLLGNMFIGTTMGIPFIFADISFSGGITEKSLYLFSIAFIVGFAREIVKSVEDYKGDLMARGSRTLPIIIGPKLSMMIAGLIFLMFVPISFYFIVLMSDFSINLATAALLFISYVIIIYSLLECFFCTGECIGEARMIKKLTFFAMAVGLIAIFVSSLSM